MTGGRLARLVRVTPREVFRILPQLPAITADLERRWREHERRLVMVEGATDDALAMVRELQYGQPIEDREQRL